MTIVLLQWHKNNCATAIALLHRGCFQSALISNENQGFGNGITLQMSWRYDS